MTNAWVAFEDASNNCRGWTSADVNDLGGAWVTGEADSTGCSSSLPIFCCDRDGGAGQFDSSYDRLVGD